jgi:hypothetical protein
VVNVERNYQNRYYDAYEDSDIYESEFQKEELIYDDREQAIGGDNAIDDPGRQDYNEENDLDRQYRNAIDLEEYDHQHPRGYMSNNPNRLRKPSKRRYMTDAERQKRKRNHYIMQNLGVRARR